MPRTLGQTVGVSPRTELLVMTFLGMATSAMDLVPFNMFSQLRKVRSLPLPELAFNINENSGHWLKTILSMVVMVRHVTIPLHLLFYIMILYSIMTMDHASQLLPWLVLQVIKNIAPDAVVFVAGVFVCWAEQVSWLIFCEFVVVELISTFPSIYMWRSIRAYYKELTDAKYLNHRLTWLTNHRKAASRSLDAVPTKKISFDKRLRVHSFSTIAELFGPPALEIDSFDNKFSQSLATLMTVESRDSNIIVDVLSMQFVDDPYLTPAEKSLKILKMTQEDVTAILARVNKTASSVSLELKAQSINNDNVEASVQAVMPSDGEFCEDDIEPNSLSDKVKVQPTTFSERISESDDVTTDDVDEFANDPDLTPAQKSLKILKMTQEDVTAILARVNKTTSALSLELKALFHNNDSVESSVQAGRSPDGEFRDIKRKAHSLPDKVEVQSTTFPEKISESDNITRGDVAEFMDDSDKTPALESPKMLNTSEEDVTVILARVNKTASTSSLQLKPLYSKNENVGSSVQAVIPSVHEFLEVKIKANNLPDEVEVQPTRFSERISESDVNVTRGDFDVFVENPEMIPVEKSSIEGAVVKENTLVYNLGNCVCSEAGRKDDDAGKNNNALMDQMLIPKAPIGSLSMQKTPHLFMTDGNPSFVDTSLDNRVLGNVLIDDNNKGEGEERNKFNLCGTMKCSNGSNKNNVKTSKFSLQTELRNTIIGNINIRNELKAIEKYGKTAPISESKVMNPDTDSSNAEICENNSKITNDFLNDTLRTSKMENELMSLTNESSHRFNKSSIPLIESLPRYRAFESSVLNERSTKHISSLKCENHFHECHFHNHKDMPENIPERRQTETVVEAVVDGKKIEPHHDHSKQESITPEREDGSRHDQKDLEYFIANAGFKLNVTTAKGSPNIFTTDLSSLNKNISSSNIPSIPSITPREQMSNCTTIPANVSNYRKYTMRSEESCSVNKFPESRQGNTAACFNVKGCKEANKNSILPPLNDTMDFQNTNAVDTIVDRIEDVHYMNIQKEETTAVYVNGWKDSIKGVILSSSNDTMVSNTTKAVAEQFTHRVGKVVQYQENQKEEMTRLFDVNRRKEPIKSILFPLSTGTIDRKTTVDMNNLTNRIGKEAQNDKTGNTSFKDVSDHLGIVRELQRTTTIPVSSQLPHVVKNLGSGNWETLRNLLESRLMNQKLNSESIRLRRDQCADDKGNVTSWRKVEEVGNKCGNDSPISRLINQMLNNESIRSRRDQYTDDMTNVQTGEFGKECRTISTTPKYGCESSVHYSSIENTALNHVEVNGSRSAGSSKEQSSGNHLDAAEASDCQKGNNSVQNTGTQTMHEHCFNEQSQTSNKSWPGCGQEYNGSAFRKPIFRDKGAQVDVGDKKYGTDRNNTGWNSSHRIKVDSSHIMRTCYRHPKPQSEANATKDNCKYGAVPLNFLRPQSSPHHPQESPHSSEDYMDPRSACSYISSKPSTYSNYLNKSRSNSSHLDSSYSVTEELSRPQNQNVSGIYNFDKFGKRTSDVHSQITRQICLAELESLLWKVDNQKVRPHSKILKPGLSKTRDNGGFKRRDRITDEILSALPKEQFKPIVASSQNASISHRRKMSLPIGKDNWGTVTLAQTAHSSGYEKITFLAEPHETFNDSKVFDTVSGYETTIPSVPLSLKKSRSTFTNELLLLEKKGHNKSRKRPSISIPRSPKTNRRSKQATECVAKGQTTSNAILPKTSMTSKASSGVLACDAVVPQVVQKEPLLFKGSGNERSRDCQPRSIPGSSKIDRQSEAAEEKEAREMRALRAYNEKTLLRYKRELEAKDRSIRETDSPNTENHRNEETNQNAVLRQESDQKASNRQTTSLYGRFARSKPPESSAKHALIEQVMAPSENCIAIDSSNRDSNLLKIDKREARLILKLLESYSGSQLKQELRKIEASDQETVRKRFSKYSKPDGNKRKTDVSSPSCKAIEGVQEGRDLSRTPAKENIRENAGVTCVFQRPEEVPEMVHSGSSSTTLLNSSTPQEQLSLIAVPQDFEDVPRRNGELQSNRTFRKSRILGTMREVMRNINWIFHPPDFVEVNGSRSQRNFEGHGSAPSERQSVHRSIHFLTTEVSLKRAFSCNPDNPDRGSHLDRINDPYPIFNNLNFTMGEIMKVVMLKSLPGQLDGLSASEIDVSVPDEEILGRLPIESRRYGTIESRSRRDVKSGNVSDKEECKEPVTLLADFTNVWKKWSDVQNEVRPFCCLDGGNFQFEMTADSGTLERLNSEKVVVREILNELILQVYSSETSDPSRVSKLHDSGIYKMGTIKDERESVTALTSIEVVECCGTSEGQSFSAFKKSIPVGEELCGQSISVEPSVNEILTESESRIAPIPATHSTRHIAKLPSTRGDEFEQNQTEFEIPIIVGTKQKSSLEVQDSQKNQPQMLHNIVSNNDSRESGAILPRDSELMNRFMFRSEIVNSVVMESLNLGPLSKNLLKPWISQEGIQIDHLDLDTTETLLSEEDLNSSGYVSSAKNNVSSESKRIGNRANNSPELTVLETLLLDNVDINPRIEVSVLDKTSCMVETNMQILKTDDRFTNHTEHTLNEGTLEENEVSILKTLRYSIREELEKQRNLVQTVTNYAVPTTSSLLPGISQMEKNDINRNKGLQTSTADEKSATTKPIIYSHESLSHPIPRPRKSLNLNTFKNSELAEDSSHILHDDKNSFHTRQEKTSNIFLTSDTNMKNEESYVALSLRTDDFGSVEKTIVCQLKETNSVSQAGISGNLHETNFLQTFVNPVENSEVFPVSRSRCQRIPLRPMETSWNSTSECTPFLDNPEESTNQTGEKIEKRDITAVSATSRIFGENVEEIDNYSQERRFSSLEKDDEKELFASMIISDLDPQDGLYKKIADVLSNAKLSIIDDMLSELMDLVHRNSEMKDHAELKDKVLQIVAMPQFILIESLVNDLRAASKFMKTNNSDSFRSHQTTTTSTDSGSHIHCAEEIEKQKRDSDENSTENNQSDYKQIIIKIPSTPNDTSLEQLYVLRRRKESVSESTETVSYERPENQSKVSLRDVSILTEQSSKDFEKLLELMNMRGSQPPGENSVERKKDSESIIEISYPAIIQSTNQRNEILLPLVGNCYNGSVTMISSSKTDIRFLQTPVLENQLETQAIDKSKQKEECFPELVLVNKKFPVVEEKPQGITIDSEEMVPTSETGEADIRLQLIPLSEDELDNQTDCTNETKYKCTSGMILVNKKISAVLEVFPINSEAIIPLPKTDTSDISFPRIQLSRNQVDDEVNGKSGRKGNSSPGLVVAKRKITGTMEVPRKLQTKILSSKTDSTGIIIPHILVSKDKLNQQVNGESKNQETSSSEFISSDNKLLITVQVSREILKVPRISDGILLRRTSNSSHLTNKSINVSSIGIKSLDSLDFLAPDSEQRIPSASMSSENPVFVSSSIHAVTNISNVTNKCSLLKSESAITAASGTSSAMLHAVDISNGYTVRERFSNLDSENYDSVDSSESGNTFETAAISTDTLSVGNGTLMEEFSQKTIASCDEPTNSRLNGSKLSSGEKSKEHGGLFSARKSGSSGGSLRNTDANSTKSKREGQNGKLCARTSMQRKRVNKMERKGEIL